MSAEILFLVEEADDGGFIARAVGADIFTEGDTLDELAANIREAVSCHHDDGHEPRLIRTVFVE